MVLKPPENSRRTRFHDSDRRGDCRRYARRQKTMSSGRYERLSSETHRPETACRKTWQMVTGGDSRETGYGIRRFQLEDLMHRLMGDKRLARLILNAFLKDAPQQLAFLRKHLETADTAEIRARHTLCGGPRLPLPPLTFSPLPRPSKALEKADRSTAAGNSCPERWRSLNVIGTPSRTRAGWTPAPQKQRNERND